MNIPQKIRQHLRALFRKEKLEAEMAEEMRLHLEMQTERNVAAGLSPEEARYAAQRQFGGVEQIKEIAREQRGVLWIEQSWRDLRYAFRQLATSPGFTAVAVITLALGIGVNSAMFGFLRDMLLRPLLHEKHERLAALYTSFANPGASFRAFSYAEFAALRETSEVFSSLAAMTFDSAAVGRGDAVKRRLVCFVSDNYFPVLGVRPLAGRFFSREEAQPNGGIPVVVAHYAFWQRLGFPADFVGSEIQINSHSFTVIGIAPPGFGGLHNSVGPEVWLPFGALPQAFSRADNLLDARTYRLALFGNLRPDLTMERARVHMGAMERRLDVLSDASDPHRLFLTPPPHFSLGNNSPVDESFLVSFAGLAFGLSATVLLVACLNLANMLLARGMARQKEIALRLSLGATRGRIIRQLLVESLLIALLGGAFGLPAATWSGDLLRGFSSAAANSSAFAFNIAGSGIDLTALLVSGLFCGVATMVFGLVPAVRVTRIDLVSDLKQQSGEPAVRVGWNRFFSFRHCLVMAQIALSLMLIFSAGLFVQGTFKAVGRDPGFKTTGELVFNLDYGITGLSGAPVWRRQEALLVHAANVQGVADAALASAVPYNFELNYRRVFAAGSNSAVAPSNGRSSSGLRAGDTAVSRGYFQTLGIPFLRGRDFTAEENQTDNFLHVVIIDEQLARALFGNDDVLGRHLTTDEAPTDGARPDREAEVVGIVRSPHDDVWEDAAPQRIYRPLAQVRAPNTYLHVHVTSVAAMNGVLETLRRDLHTLDPNTPLLMARPLADFVDTNMNLILLRVIAGAFGTFGIISLILAVVGVYGVKAFEVATRTREIGIRLALGARPVDVRTLILRQGALQVAVGAAAGIILALLAGQALSKMLFRVSPANPLVLGLSAVLVSLAALGACLIPARRATKVDPMVALRCE